MIEPTKVSDFYKCRSGRRGLIGSEQIGGTRNVCQVLVAIERGKVGWRGKRTATVAVSPISREALRAHEDITGLTLYRKLR